MSLRRRMLTVAVCTIASSTEAAAQDPPATVTLRYANGQIVEGHLPFSRRFMINGSTVTTGGRADVVLLRVSEIPKPTKQNPKPAATPVDSSCWVRPPESAADSFVVAVKALTMERSYRLSFTFARLYRPNVIDRAFQEAADETMRAMDTAAISSDSVGQIFTAKLRDALRVAAAGQTKFLRVVAEGMCAVTDSAPKLALDSAALRTLSRHAQSIGGFRADVNDAREKLRPAFKALDAIDAAELETLGSRLRNAIPQSRRAGRPYRYDSAAVGAMTRAVQRKDASLLSESAWNDLNAAAQDTRPRAPLSAADRALLERVLGAIVRLRGARQDIAARESDLRDAEAQALPATTQIRTVVEQSYTPIAQAGAQATSWGGETEVRKLRIGTGVGGGNALLSPFSEHRDSDGFLFVVLRYYPGPVDRSLSHPWSSRWARLSVDVGALFQSTLRYEGQNLTNAFGGLSPVIGLSWDADRYLAVGAGIVVFRQPSVNPANNSARENINAAPYVALSVDVDALNTLRNRLK